MKLRTKQTIGAVAACVALCLVPAYAQTATSTSINPLSQAERAANLYGKELVGPGGAKIGKVADVVADLESEHILYVVVNSDKGNVGVAPQVIGQTTGNTLHATVSKKKIEGAPQFTSAIDKPDQLGQANFVYQVYQYFGLNPWWKGNTPANEGSFNNVHKLKELIGMNVESVNNEPMGKISHVVVDMPSARVLYVVFSPASSLNLGDNLYAMPSDAFTLSKDQSHLVTGVAKDKLASAPHFANNNWPTLTDPTFASQVYQYYGKQAWFNNGSSNYQPTGR